MYAPEMNMVVMQPSDMAVCEICMSNDRQENSKGTEQRHAHLCNALVTDEELHWGALQAPWGLPAARGGAWQHEVGSGLQLHGGHDLAALCMPRSHHRRSATHRAWGEDS